MSIVRRKVYAIDIFLQIFSRGKLFICRKFCNFARKTIKHLNMSKYEIPYLTACIQAFGRRFSMTRQAAFRYLHEYKGPTGRRGWTPRTKSRVFVWTDEALLVSTADSPHIITPRPFSWLTYNSCVPMVASVRAQSACALRMFLFWHTLKKLPLWAQKCLSEH